MCLLQIEEPIFYAISNFEIIFSSFPNSSFKYQQFYQK